MKWFNVTLSDPLWFTDFGDVCAETANEALKIVVGRVTREKELQGIGFNPEPLRACLIARELD